MKRTRVLLVGALAIVAASFTSVPLALASGGHGPAAVVDETMFPAAKRGTTAAEAAANSAGCVSCHTSSDSKTMHTSGKVELGCADCHGGNVAVTLPAGANPGDAETASAIGTNLKKLPESDVTVLTRHAGALLEARIQTYAPELLT